jgi:hypothetical protein
MAQRVQPSVQFVKSTDVLIRLAAITTRPVITISGQDWTIDQSLTYKELQAAPTGDASHDKTEQSYRFIGDDGFKDSSFTDERLSSSFTSFWVRDNVNSYALDEAVEILYNADNDRDKEVFVQIFEYLGFNSSNSKYIYTASIYSACVSNLKKSYPADNQVSLSFSLMSRGRAFSGYYASSSILRTDAPNAS